jgi:hypothetical protein
VIQVSCSGKGQLKNVLTCNWVLSFTEACDMRNSTSSSGGRSACGMLCLALDARTTCHMNSEATAHSSS